jgi:hypothetical protein
LRGWLCRWAACLIQLCYAPHPNAANHEQTPPNKGIQLTPLCSDKIGRILESSFGPTAFPI